MRRTFITYFIFIVAMSAFIMLRIYAGSHKDMMRPSVATDTEKPSEDAQTQTEENNVAALRDETAEEEEEEVIDPALKDDKEYLWHGPINPETEFTGLLPRIVCWGDSLTVSLDGKSAYPDILRDLSGCEVVNYGVESENTAMIAMREGGLRVKVKATVLPSGSDLIPIFLRTEDDGHVFYLDNGDGGVNPCSINGIQGELQKINGSYYFKRASKGERYVVDEGTQFKTFAMTDAKEGDILVIFAGTNDLPDARSVNNIIELERSMLEAVQCDKYIIVGLTYAGGIPEINEVNEALSKEFGDHFVDIRKYMINYGVEDVGITKTKQDIADIKKGEIPTSLRRDYVHGNKHYHRLLGEQIYRRMVYLGYLKQPEGENT